MHADRRSHLTLLAGFALAMAAVAVYAGSLRSPFVFDDVAAILESPNVKSLTPLSQALTGPPSTGACGRPLVALSLALNYAMGGYDVFGYRLFDVVVHALCGVFLFGVARRTLLALAARRPGAEGAAQVDGTAFAIGLLWVVHPLATDAVDLVITRNETLMALCFLATLWASARGFTSARPARWLSAAVACCFLGMASKENMAAAPPLVLLYDRCLFAGTFGDALRLRRGFYAGLAASWLLLLGLAMGAERGATVGFDLGVAPLEYLAVQVGVLLHYLRLAFWPSPLVMDYGTWSAFQGAGAGAAESLAVLLLVAATAWLAWRRQVAGFLGCVFFAVLAPTSSFVPITGEVAAEHRMYLPLAAVVSLVVIAARAVLRRTVPAPSVRVGVGAVLVLVCAGSFGTLTVRRNADYSSAAGIWGDTFQKRPANGRASFNMGYQLHKAGRLAAALESYRRVLRVEPENAEAHLRVARLSAALDAPADAAEHYALALRFDPDIHEVVFAESMKQVEARDHAGAVPLLREALELRPGDADCELWLVWLLSASGDARVRDGAEAVRVGEALCARSETAPAAWLDALAAAYAEAGRMSDAVRTGERARDLARERGRRKLASAIEGRLAQYRRGEAYRL